MKRSFENIKIAFQALLLNKLRSFLTMLGIIIGVGAVITVMAIGSGAQESIISNVQSMGTNLLTISPGRDSTTPGSPPERGGFMGPQSSENSEEDTVAGELYLADYKEIKNVSQTITGATAVISKNSLVSYMGVSEQVSITAATPEIFTLQNYSLSKGAFFSFDDIASSSSVAVIGSQVVDDYFGMIEPLGKTIRIENQNFTVIGVLESVGTSAMGADLDLSVFIPLTAGQNKLYGTDEVDRIVVQVKSEDLIDASTSEIKTILRQQHSIMPADLNDFSISSQTQMLEAMSTITNTLSITLAGIAAISLLVGGIGIMNIMLVSVTERTREISIRKAIGAKNKDILTQFLTESIVLSIIGGILGILFAVSVSYLLQKFVSFNTVITATPIILSLTFSTLIGLLFGIVPAMRAARLNPIESLRYE